MSTHQVMFDWDMAKAHGSDIAILYKYIYTWVVHNKAKCYNYKDGKWWVYNTRDSLKAEFPWWSVRKISALLEKMEKRHLIVKGNYNKLKCDRTGWYALVDESTLPITENERYENSAPSDALSAKRLGTLCPASPKNTCRLGTLCPAVPGSIGSSRLKAAVADAPSPLYPSTPPPLGKGARTKKEKKIYDLDSREFLLAQLFLAVLVGINPKYRLDVVSSESKKTVMLQEWADIFRKLLENRKRDLQEIIDVIDFISVTEFWWGNIESANGFYKKYDTLQNQMYSKNKKATSTSTHRTTRYSAAELDEARRKGIVVITDEDYKNTGMTTSQKHCIESENNV